MDNSTVKFWRNIRWLNHALRHHTDLSLSDWMNWSSGDVVALELGEAPTIDQLSELHLCLGFSYQDLIDKDISLQQERLLEYLDTRTPQSLQEPMPLFEVPLCVQKVGAGSIVQSEQMPAKAGNIARICVPQSFFNGAPQAELMAFEIDGYSMHPGVQSGDVVLGTPISGVEEVKDGACYIILLSNNRLLFKRAYHLADVQRHTGLQLASDNLDYHSFIVPKSDIQKIWSYSHHLGKI